MLKVLSKIKHSNARLFLRAVFSSKNEAHIRYRNCKLLSISRHFSSFIPSHGIYSSKEPQEPQKTTGLWIEQFFDNYVDSVVGNLSKVKPHLNLKTVYKNLPYELAERLRMTSDEHRWFEEVVSYKHLSKIPAKVVIGFYNERLDNMFVSLRNKLSRTLLAKSVNYMLTHKEYDFAVRLTLDTVFDTIDRLPQDDSLSSPLEMLIFAQPKIEDKKLRLGISLVDLDDYITLFYTRYRSCSLATEPSSSDNVNLDYIIFLQHLFNTVIEQCPGANTELALKQLLHGFLNFTKLAFPDMYNLFVFITQPSMFTQPSEMLAETPNIEVEHVFLSFQLNHQLTKAYRNLSQSSNKEDILSSYMAYIIYLYAQPSPMMLSTYKPNNSTNHIHNIKPKTPVLVLIEFSFLNLVTVLQHLFQLGQVEQVSSVLDSLKTALNNVLRQHIGQIKTSSKSDFDAALFQGGLAQKILQNTTTDTSMCSHGFDTYLTVFKKLRTLHAKVRPFAQKAANTSLLDRSLVTNLVQISSILRFNDLDYNLLIKQVHTLEDMNMLIQYFVKLQHFRASSPTLSLQTYHYILGKFSMIMNRALDTKLNVRKHTEHDRFINYFKLVSQSYYKAYGTNGRSSEGYGKIAHTLVACLAANKASIAILLENNEQYDDFNTKILGKVLNLLLKNFNDKNVLTFLQTVRLNFSQLPRLPAVFLSNINIHVAFADLSKTDLTTTRILKILKLSQWNFEEEKMVRKLLVLFKILLNTSSFQNSSEDFKYKFLDFFYNPLFTVARSPTENKELRKLFAKIIVRSQQFSTSILFEKFRDKPNFREFKTHILSRLIRSGYIEKDILAKLIILSPGQTKSQQSDAIRTASLAIEYLAAHDVRASEMLFNHIMQNVSTHCPELHDSAFHRLKCATAMGVVKNWKTLTSKRIRIGTAVIKSLLKLRPNPFYIPPHIFEQFLINYTLYTREKNTGSVKFLEWLFLTYNRVGKRFFPQRVPKFNIKLEKLLVSMKLDKKGFWSHKNMMKSDFSLRKYNDL